MPPIEVVVKHLIETEANKIDPPFIALDYGEFIDEPDLNGFYWYTIYVVLKHPVTGAIRVVSCEFREDE